MNMYFPQVEKRSQFLSYLLAAFAISVALMLILSFSRFFAQRRTISSTSSQVVHTEITSVPVAIPAPLPPTDQNQVSVTPSPSIGATCSTSCSHTGTFYAIIEMR